MAAPIPDTRSTLRRLGAEHEGRRKSKFVRFLLLAAIATAIYLFIQAVTTRAFEPSGLGVLIYGLHDNVYLWIKGMIWVKFFPYTLIWFVPLMVLLFLCLVEYVTPLSPIRAIHRRGLLALAERRWARRLFGKSLIKQRVDDGVWKSSLEPQQREPRRRFGFARRVVHQAQEALWARVAIDFADGNGPARRVAKRLIRLTDIRLRFDPSFAPAHVRAIEIIAALPGESNASKLKQELLAFYAAQSSQAFVGPLAKALSRLDEIDVKKPAAAAQLLREISLDLQSYSLRKNNFDAQMSVALACDALIAFNAAHACRSPDVFLFQRLWVKARLSKVPVGLSEKFANAGALIFFEMWSRYAEWRQAIPKTSPLLKDAIADGSEVTDDLTIASERFAWEGAVS